MHQALPGAAIKEESPIESALLFTEEFSLVVRSVYNHCSCMEAKPTGYWNSKTLSERLPTVIEPFNAARIASCSYELSMGSEAFVTGDKVRTILGPTGEVVIPPGQLCVLLTEESVTVPNDAIAFISMKSKHKFRGLINVSGFHVDPGFKGKLVFTAYNAGVQEIHISYGTPVFVIWFAYLDSNTSDTYHGHHQGQQRIPDEVITNLAAKIPSPASLQEEIKELRNRVTNYSTIVAVVVSIFIATLVRSWFVDSRPTPPPPQAQLDRADTSRQNQPMAEPAPQLPQSPVMK